MMIAFKAVYNVNVR